MCFVWISEQTAIISLYSINWLVFIPKTVFTVQYGLDLYIRFRLMLVFKVLISRGSKRTRKILCAELTSHWLVPMFIRFKWQCHSTAYCFKKPKVFWFAVCTVLFNVCAVGLWAVQFYQKLQQNVLSQEDRDNQWSSANMAHYGYSFWWVADHATLFTTLVLL